MSRYDKIVADLQPGEELLWSEKPGPVTVFMQKTGLVPVFFFTTFFAMVFFATSADGSGHWFFVFFAVLVYGTFFYEAVSAFWTLYAITTKRLIILHPSMFSSIVESYYPPDIDFVKKIKRRGGSGSVIFSAVREQKGKRTQTVEIGFFGIDDVDLVEAMILDLRTHKKPNKAPEPTPGSVTPHADA